MNDFAKAMPLLARHEGVWDGTYTYFNDRNEKIDEHASRLLCRITGDDETPYHQTNHYTWPTAGRKCAIFLRPIATGACGGTTS